MWYVVVLIYSSGDSDSFYDSRASSSGDNGDCSVDSLTIVVVVLVKIK